MEGVSACNQPSLIVAVTARDSLLFARIIAAGMVKYGWAVEILHGSQGAFPVGARICTETEIEPLRRQPSALGDLLALRVMVGLLRHRRPSIVLSATPKAGLVAAVSSRITHTPHIHHVWGLRSQGLSGRPRRLQEVAEGLTVRLADSALAVSPSLAEDVSQLPSVTQGPEVLRFGSSHGVDLQRFVPNTCPPPADAVPTVGFLGRFHPDKGIADLEPLAQLLRSNGHRFRLVLYGSPDPTTPEVLPILRRLEKVDEVVFHDRTVGVPEYLRTCHVAVFPSRREGMPNAVLEASASGIPTIAYDATGTRDCVLDGVTGRLVPAGDVRRLAAACSEYLSDDVLRGEHGLAARRFVEERFGQSDVLAELDRYLRAQVLS